MPATVCCFSPGTPRYKNTRTNQTNKQKNYNIDCQQISRYKKNVWPFDQEYFSWPFQTWMTPEKNPQLTIWVQLVLLWLFSNLLHFFATWGNRFADLFDPQLKMVSAGQIGGISKRFKIVPKLLGGSSTVSLKLILPYILEPQHVCPIFWKYKMNDCRFSFSPTSAIGKSCTNFLYSPPFLLNLKKMSKLILNPVAICYNIMHTFILEFNIAQIFKCTLKYRSTWPLKLLLHDIYFS